MAQTNHIYVELMYYRVNSIAHHCILHCRVCGVLNLKSNNFQFCQMLKNSPRTCGSCEQSASVDNKYYFENGHFFLVLKFNVHARPSIKSNFSRPVSNGHNFLQRIKGQGCKKERKKIYIINLLLVFL